MKKTEPLSSAALRARVIAALARREHSRHELYEKFSALAETPAELETVLAGLEQEGLLSDRRYAESVARRRGARLGVNRVRLELRQKGVPDTQIDDIVADLRQSEADRLRQVWQKKFGVPPQSLQDAARQQRFLMQRGFSSALIAALLRSLKEH